MRFKEPLLWTNVGKQTVTYEKSRSQKQLLQYQPWAYNMGSNYYRKIYSN